MTLGHGAAGAAAAGFVVGADGTRWGYSGALTFANAGAVLAAASALPLPTEGDVDLDSLSSADSAAVAVLLALKRRASTEGARITFVNAPAALTDLAVLYGVEDILAG